MKVLLRADASDESGTGHVMRCLTLAEALGKAGHEAILITNKSGVSWLEDLIESQDSEIVQVDEDSLDAALISNLRPDWLVVDSYRFSPYAVSRCRKITQVMAIIDGDDLSLEADLYLDHNIGAEALPWSSRVKSRLLAGSRFALIRDSIITVRRENPWQFGLEIPHVVAVMGGSDPTGAIIPVTKALCSVDIPFTATLVTAPQWKISVESLVQMREAIRIADPTPDLPSLLSKANVAISAAGTSSWEICTLGIPSVLISVVENQRLSLSQLKRQGLVLGLDSADYESKALVLKIRESFLRLIADASLRRQLSERCFDTFDGLGPQRVVESMSSATNSRNVCFSP